MKEFNLSVTTLLLTGIISLPLTGLGAQDVPARIEAEAFSKSSATPTINTLSEWGHQSISMNAGSWIEHQFNVLPGNEGEFIMTARIKTTNKGKRFHLLMNGNNVTGSITAPNTKGEFCDHKVVLLGEVDLGVGKHTVRVVFDDDGIAYDWTHLKNVDLMKEVAFAPKMTFLGLHFPTSIAGTSHSAHDSYSRSVGAKPRSPEEYHKANQSRLFVVNDSADWNKLIDAFDVDALADQLADAGVKMLIFGLGQNDGYYGSPNATYRKITGRTKGEYCSNRDLVADLSAALGKKGIKLGLYLPCRLGGWDDIGEVAYGYNWKQWDANLNETNTKNWADTVQEWSERWGDKIDYWWVDGFYPSLTHFERNQDYYYSDKLFGMLFNAIKAGNRSAVVSFKGSDYDDYEDGETADWYKFMPIQSIDQRYWVAEETRQGDKLPSVGRPFHILTFFGNGWAARDQRNRARWPQAAAYIRELRRHHIFSAWDNGANYGRWISDPKYSDSTTPVGTFSKEGIAGFKGIANYLKLPTPPAIEPKQMVANIDFEDDLTDSIANDRSTFGNHLGFHLGYKASQVVAGPPGSGNAIQLTEENDALSIGFRPGLYGESFSLGVSVKAGAQKGFSRLFDSVDSGPSVVSKDIYSGQAGFAVAKQDRYWKFRIRDGHSSFKDVTFQDPSNDTWAQITVVYEAVTRKAILYYDGVEKASQEGTYLPSDNHGLKVGEGSDGHALSRFIGSVDNIYLFNYALDQQRVQTLYKRITK